eukprot:m.49290 g.49290  ORF g.49290 m.49290 type:complete len:618 (+) comp12808_c0_seq1:140-1993(+)
MADEPPPAALEQRKRIGVFSLLVVAFFWVNGGCYGNEALLQAGPPATVFLLLTITPFIYSVPLALISVELTCAMPMEGGMASWVQLAFGRVIGGHNTYWIFVSYLVDSSVYPVLAGEYLVDELQAAGIMDELAREQAISLVASLIVLLVFGIKMLGTDWLMRFSTVVAACSLLPIAIYVLAGLRKLEPAQWVVTEHPLPIDWALMLSWQLWLYSGFMGLGTLAAELENPRRSMLLVIAMLIPIILCVNNLPLMVGLGVDDDIANYEPGYFNELADELVGGRWLGWFLTVGAQVVMIGLHNACTAVCERSVSQFVNSRVSPVYMAGLLRRPGLVGWLFDPAKHGVGPAYICFSSGMNLLLVWAPYKLLVNMGMLLICFPVFLLCAAFVWFRLRQPGLARPFRVPGNMAVAVLVAVLPCCMTFTNLYYFIITDAEPVFGVDHINVYVSFFLVFLGIVVHLIYWRFYDRAGPDYLAKTAKQRMGQADESTPLLQASDDNGGGGGGGGGGSAESAGQGAGHRRVREVENMRYGGEVVGEEAPSPAPAGNSKRSERNTAAAASASGEVLSLSSLSSADEPSAQLQLGPILFLDDYAHNMGGGDAAGRSAAAAAADTASTSFA